MEDHKTLSAFSAPLREILSCKQRNQFLLRKEFLEFSISLHFELKELTSWSNLNTLQKPIHRLFSSLLRTMIRILSFYILTNTHNA
jgi:hypothetical protein